MLDEPKVNIVSGTFLDMSKAFDKMDNGKLIENLATCGINKLLWPIIRGFLSQQQQTFKLGNEHSSILSTKSGTPQGTLLSPMIWLLYIDALSTSCTTIRYVDDVTLIPSTSSENTEQLQQAVDDTTIPQNGAPRII